MSICAMQGILHAGIMIPHAVIILGDEPMGVGSVVDHKCEKVIEPCSNTQDCISWYHHIQIMVRKYVEL